MGEREGTPSFTKSISGIWADDKRGRSSSRIVKAAPTETRTTITDEQALEQRWRPGQVWSSDLVTSEFLWSCLLSAVRHTLGPGLNIWTRELGFLFVFVGSLNNGIKLQLHQPVESVFWQSREQCCVVVSCGGPLGPALSMCPRKNSRIIQSACRFFSPKVLSGLTPEAVGVGVDFLFFFTSG